MLFPNDLFVVHSRAITIAILDNSKIETIRQTDVVSEVCLERIATMSETDRRQFIKDINSDNVENFIDTVAFVFELFKILKDNQNAIKTSASRLIDLLMWEYTNKDNEQYKTAKALYAYLVE